MFKIFLCISALTFFGAGCGNGSSSVASMAGLSSCSNAYYPLNKGAKISYLSRIGEKTSNIDVEVTDIGSDYAMLTYHLGPTLTMDQKVTCTKDGLVIKAYFNPSMKDQSKVKTISSSGQFLPKDIHVGSEWSDAYQAEMTNDSFEAQKLGMSKTYMDTTSKNTVIGEESVIVPAGTFTALKVKSVNTVAVKLKANSPGMPGEITTYNYFVKGKGLVKTITTQGGITIGMEATSISTP